MKWLVIEVVCMVAMFAEVIYVNTKIEAWKEAALQCHTMLHKCTEVTKECLSELEAPKGQIVKCHCEDL